MASTTDRVLSENNWRVELVFGSTSLGYWDHEEIELGGEGGKSYDPELGEMLRGSRQTIEDMPISRPFLMLRDTAAYKLMAPLRLKAIGKAHLWVIDPETLQPATSSPLDSWNAQIKTIKLPSGSKAGDDESRFAGTVSLTAVSVAA